MSEVDSLSDSEWLEISSNQESDNDSLSSRDSDHDDLPSMPPSRRSSISVGSSADGEIDAWEGFADDTPDQVAGADPVVAAFAAAEHASPRRMLDSHGNIAEEQFVTAALEQSLVGTLSASRSSSLGVSSTVHNSLRDLRLSFPDPITSSRDELNRSYEAVSSSDCITDDDPNSPMTTVFPGEAPLREKSPLRDESNGHLSDDLETLPESDPLPVHRRVGYHINDFDVVLYGSTAQSRDFAEWLLSTFIIGGALVSSEHGDTTSQRRFFSHSEGTVTTRDGNLNAPSSQTSARPSLAIVSLPATASRLPEHTVYLPVLFPATGSGQAGVSGTSRAYESWALLDIPAIRTLRLIEGSESKASEPYIIVDSAELRDRVRAKFIYRELRPLLVPLTPPTKKASGMLEQLRPVHAVTLVALLSLIMGFAVNTAFHSPSLVPTSVTVSNAPVHTTTASTSFWGMFGASPNSSVAPITTTSCPGNMAIMPSTLKDFALAVFNPATTTPSLQVGSLSTAPSPSGPCGSGATGSPVGQCKPMTWSERAKSTKDVIIRPPTALSNPQMVKAPPTHTPSVGESVGKVTALPVDESAQVTSLSLKFVDSLSEVADIAMKALEEVVARDFKELMSALDDLMRAVGRQTSMIVADSKNRAQILRERLQYRNERAKGKARELKQRGEHIVSLASERLKARAEIAKRRAHSLKKSLMSTSVWRTYAQAHGEWSEKLETKAKGKRRDGKRERKVGLFAKLKQKRENRKKRLSA
ncbi:hypothetical protein DFH09DRAFT_285674 [Mycena vulgaris]|nr:hypothetical protein DFH09DRAFT_285674 [Mycena vulgaris]